MNTQKEQIKLLPRNREQQNFMLTIARPTPKCKMCKQVSRLGFILQSTFPHIAVAYCPFVSFTVIGIARKFHPNSLGVLPHQHFRANTHAIFICDLYITSIICTFQDLSGKVYYFHQPSYCKTHVIKSIRMAKVNIRDDFSFLI